jgi:hypothetical protein
MLADGEIMISVCCSGGGYGGTALRTTRFSGR